MSPTVTQPLVELSECEVNDSQSKLQEIQRKYEVEVQNRQRIEKELQAFQEKLHHADQVVF